MNDPRERLLELMAAGDLSVEDLEADATEVLLEADDVDLAYECLDCSVEDMLSEE